MYTMSREQLQQLPAKHRMEAIHSVVNQYSQQVVNAATAGKAFHLVDLATYFKQFRSGGGEFKVTCHTYPPPYIPTADDLVEGFKEKFPGCRVEYTETWEDVRPGVKEQKSGLLVDWS